jgi:aryl-alcohol dehydrogenase-like predicted oxidoreductase
LRPLEYRRFGRTGIKVSVLGLGAGGFGGVGSARELVGRGEDEETAFAIMDRALELGINYFDTANSYAAGRSEEMVGAWLASRNVRDQIVLSTKVFNPMSDDANDRGLSRRHILHQIDASLKRLRTDWVDVYVTHEVDRETELEETMRAFDDLVRAGKVRYVGASNIEAWRLAKALWVSDKRGYVRFESVQNEYNLLHRQAESEVLPLAVDQRLAVTPFSPLAGGWLTGKYRRGAPHPPGSRMTLRPEPYLDLDAEPNWRAIDVLAAEAASRRVSTAALALAWVTSHPAVTAALIGPRSLAQFEPAVESLGIRLDAADRAALVTEMEHARTAV